MADWGLTAFMQQGLFLASVGDAFYRQRHIITAEAKSTPGAGELQRRRTEDR